MKSSFCRSRSRRRSCCLANSAPSRKSGTMARPPYKERKTRRPGPSDPGPAQGSERPDPRHDHRRCRRSLQAWAARSTPSRPWRSGARASAPSVPAATSAPCSRRSMAGSDAGARLAARRISHERPDRRLFQALYRPDARHLPWAAAPACRCMAATGWPMPRWISPCRKPASVSFPMSAAVISCRACRTSRACIWALTGERIGLGDALAAGLDDPCGRRAAISTP